MRTDGLPLEIERKFLIAYPDISHLDSLCFRKSEIIQTYMNDSDDDSSSRVRLRDTEGQIEYTKTVKRRINDFTREEHEEYLSRKSMKLC